MKKENNTKIMTITFALIAIIAISYIVLDKYNEEKLQEQEEIFNEGAQQGYELAIRQIVQQANTCQQIPILLDNSTINMIAVDCLEQQSE